jgi:hypothetical protein
MYYRLSAQAYFVFPVAPLFRLGSVTIFCHTKASTSLTEPDLRFALIRLFSRTHIQARCIEVMHYFGFWQRILPQVLMKVSPVERFSLTTPVKPFVYQTNYQVIEFSERICVSTYSIVLVMTSQLRTQYRPPFLHVHAITYGFKPSVQLFTFSAEFLSAGFVSNSKLSLKALVAIMRKAKKVECVSLAFLFV